MSEHKNVRLDSLAPGDMIIARTRGTKDTIVILYLILSVDDKFAQVCASAYSTVGNTYSQTFVKYLSYFTIPYEELVQLDL